MLQLADIGGAHVGVIGAPCAGEARQIAVGEGEKQNVGGRLPKVGRARAFVQKNSLRSQKVHGAARYTGAARAARIAARSMPFSPMKTRPPARGRSMGQAPSKW